MERDLASSFRKALFQGRDDVVLSLAASEDPRLIQRARYAVLHEACQAVLNNEMPFCQLVCICEAAAVLTDRTLPPIVCCGSFSGSAASVTNSFLLMLLRAFGVPVLDAGQENAPQTFLQLIQEHSIHIVTCTAFTKVEAEAVRSLHELAVATNCRSDFKLMLCGSSSDLSLPIDNPDVKLIPVALEVASWLNG